MFAHMRNKEPKQLPSARVTPMSKDYRAVCAIAVLETLKTVTCQPAP